MRRRPLLLAITTLTVGVLAVAVAALVAVRRQAEAINDAAAEMRVRLVARAVVDDLYRLDVRGLRDRLRAVRSDPEVRDAYVTDPEGVVLADGTRANARREQRLEDSFGSALVLSRTWISSREGDSLRFGGPVTTADGSLLGYVQVTFDRSGSAGAGTVTGRLLAVALLCALAGGAFLWFSLRGDARTVGVPEGESGLAYSAEGAAEEWRRLATEKASLEEERRRWHLARQQQSGGEAGSAGGAAQGREPAAELQSLNEELTRLKDELEDAKARQRVVERERAAWVADGEQGERERRDLQDSLAATERELDSVRAQLQALSEETRVREESQVKLRQEEQLRGQLEATVDQLRQEQARVLEQLAETTRERERLERLLRDIEDEHLREQEVLDQLQAVTTLPETPLAPARDLGATDAADDQRAGPPKKTGGP